MQNKPYLRSIQPRDAIDTAQDFHESVRDRVAEVLFSQSRHRKAAVMDGAAVVLLMSFMAFFGVILFALVTR